MSHCIERTCAHQWGTGRRLGRRSSVRASANLNPVAALPPVMVNSCTGKMGHAAAEALVGNGFKLVPHTFSGLSAGVAVKNIGVRGVPVQLVGNEKRQAALDSILGQYPDMMVVDYTLAHCVEEHVRFYASNGLPFVMGTAGGDRQRMREEAQAAGVYAVLPSPAGEQAASFFALLTSLGAPLPAHFDQYIYEAASGADDAEALDLLNPAASGEIARAFKLMGIQCDEAQIHRMRAARQQRVSGFNLEREPPNLRALQGRGKSRTCRLTAPGGYPVLRLRHYGLDRTAFAAGAVVAARFLAARMAEGASQRVYDMVDVLRSLEAAQATQRAAEAASRPGQQYVSNVVAATSIVTAAAVV